MQPLDLSSVIPVIAIGIFVFVCGMILVVIAKGIGEWMHNNALPVLTAQARVIAKRSEMRAQANSGHRIRTVYFVTFELQSGERSEFWVTGKESGLLAEGDEGKLSYQGTRYHGFERDV